MWSLMMLDSLVSVSFLCITYLSDFACCEVPNLDEAVHRAGDQVLTIRGEPGTLYMGFLSKLWREDERK